MFSPPSSRSISLPHRDRRPARSAFTLVEVVLAIGVLSLAIVALVALFGPTVNAVKSVIEVDQSASVASRVRALFAGNDDPATPNILEGMSLEEVAAAAAATAWADKTVFFWTRQTPSASGDTLNPAELVAAKGSQALSAIDADRSAGNLVGGVFAAVIQRSPAATAPSGGPDAYSPAVVATTSVLPVLVTLISVDVDALAVGNFSLVVNATTGRIDFNNAGTTVSVLDRLSEVTIAAMR